jgi:hypothetical protein
MWMQEEGTNTKFRSHRDNRKGENLETSKAASTDARHLAEWRSYVFAGILNRDGENNLNVSIKLFEGCSVKLPFSAFPDSRTHKSATS